MPRHDHAPNHSSRHEYTRVLKKDPVDLNITKSESITCPMAQSMGAMSRQHSPYNEQVGERVCHLFFNLHRSKQEIAFLLGNRPSKQTIGKILKRYRDNGNVVPVDGDRVEFNQHFGQWDQLAHSTLCSIIQVISR